MHNWTPLPCQTIVLRVLKNLQSIHPKTDKATSAAFMRRAKMSGKDEDGLSVSITPAELPETLAAEWRCKGIVSLHVGCIREIDLDVLQTSTTHAVIVKLPYSEDNALEAERLAGLLAQQSRTVWLPE